MGLAAEQFANTNENFATVTFEVTDGYQKIDPIDVTVTIVGNNSTLPYDGEEHTVTGYKATANSDLYDVNKDFTFSGTDSASRTDVGTTNMNLASGQFANTNPNFGTVTFEVTDGYQTIEAINVTVQIKGHTSTVDYDGAKHEVTGYDVEISNPLYKETDFTFNGTAHAERTDAGTTYMGLKPADFANTNPNFGTVTFAVTDGYQTIDPIDVTVTITGNHKTENFDGAEHSVSGYTATASTPLYKATGDAVDFEFSGEAEAARTNAGTTNMGLKPEQFANTNDNFANVTFEVTDGFVKINPIDVTVTIVGASNTATYDGEEHSVSGFTATADNDLYVVEGENKYFTFSGTAEAARTEEGTTNMGLKPGQFTNNNNNFATVTFEVTDGYQKIIPVDEVVVTITGHTSSVDYDGENHKITGYDVEISNPLYKEADFTFSGTAEAERTDAGKTMMGLDEEQFANTNKNFKTVKFEVTDGYQEIKPIDVTVNITGHTSSVDYDGEEHKVTGYDVEIGNKLYTEADFTFSGTAEAKRTDAGKTEMGLEAAQFTNTNPNFGTVKFVVTDGYQEIKPINVTVTVVGDSNTAPYDGTKHKVTGYTATADSALYDVTKDFTFSGKAEAEREDVGTTNMELKSEQFTNTNPNFGTVTFEVTDGYQTITPIDVTVTITGNTSSVDYDGESHTVTGYTATTDSKLYDVTKDFTFSGTATATRTDAGKTEMGLEAAQFTNTNPNFGTVKFVVTDGYQEIKPIDVTVQIVGNNSTDPFDGDEHTVTGYTATTDSKLYDVENDFTFSGKAEAKRTDAGTTNMGLTAAQFINTNPNFRNVTFEITDGYQTIEKIDVTVTITGNTSSVDYDGDEHTVTGFTAKSSDPLYVVDGEDKYFAFSGTAEAKRTDAGKTEMGLEAAQFTNTNPNFGTVKFVVTDGYQEIKPIDVTVTIVGANNEADYDGEEHSVSGYTATASTDLYKVTGETVDFTFSGKAEAKRTDAGTTNMGLKPGDFANNNPNFANVTFEVTDGYQTIKPIDVTVTITGNTSSVDYDGEEHKATGYTAAASTDLFDVDRDIRFSGKAEAKRTDAGKTNMELKPEQFENTNSNFASVTFEVTDGYQEIKPIDVTVTITGHHDSTTYDGAEHSVSGYDVEISNELYKEADFTFSGTAEAARTDEGKTMMNLAEDQFENTNANFKTVTFEVSDGYQEIVPVDEVVVTITGHKDSVDYDGKEHEVKGYDVEISNKLYKESDFTFSGTAEVTGTDAGTYPMGLAAEQFSNKNGNFKKVTFNVTDGSLEIKPIDVTVTITGHTSSVDYDGKEHSVSGYDVEISNKLYTEDDFTFTGTAEAKRTDAGKTMMGLAADQFTNNNKNFKTVTFDVTDGYQEIKPIDVTVKITGKTSSVPYDGAEHVISGYDVEISDPLYTEADFTFSGTAEAKRTNAGKTMMNLAESQFNNTNENFKTVTFEVEDGYQEITPIDVTVTILGNKDTADYDGTAHTVNGYTASADNDLYDVENDIEFSGTATASRTDAGTTGMGLKAEQFRNKNDNFRTVTFNVTDGYQTINPIDVTVTITGHKDSVDYDGEEHKVSGYDVSIGNELYKESDFTFSGTAEAKRTDAGKTDMGLKAEQFRNKNDNFKTVTFNVTDGYQEIKPIDVTVTITGHNNTAKYDGEEHVVTGYDVEIGNELYKESDFTFSGTAEAKRTNEGTTKMGLAANQFANTNENFKTVTFEVTDGFQTIEPIDVTVTITGHNNTTDYDGAEHSVSGYDVEISDPLYKEADFTFSGTAEAARTDAGTTGMGLKAEQFANTNSNFKNVTFNVTDGYQTIDPIDVTVTIVGNNDTKDYDGEEHSVSGYKATFSTPLYTADDFSFSGTAEAKRTDAGKTDMGLKAAQFANTNDNFANVTFDVTDGYMTINPIDVTVTITGHHNSTTFDGAEHSVSGYDVEISNELYKEADFTFSGTAEAARTDAGKTDMGLKPDQFANTNSNFGTVTFNVTDGYQEIVPVEEVVVTITGHKNTTDYDGEEHKVSGYDVEISNELYKEADFTFSGTAEAARTDAGTTEMGLAADQFENTNGNFKKVTFSVTDGYQTINKINATVTITGRNNTTDYDGEEHSVSGYDAEFSIPLYTAADFTFSGTAEAARTDAGTTGMGLAADQFKNTNKNFATVTFNVTDGYQTIDPINATVTITGHSNTAPYDGEKHSVKGYDVEFSTPLYTEADFTFSGTAEAARTDAGKTNMGLAQSQFTNNNTNFKTVTFNVTDGYQEITPINVTVTITGHNNTAPYDGEEHSVSGYDAEFSNKLYKETDFSFNGTAAAARTDAGKTGMGLKPDQFSNNNSNFAIVTFAVTDGYQAIEPVAVTIKADDKSKVYDNDPATDPELTAQVTGVPEKGVAPVYSLSRAEGQAADTYDITVTADAESNPNYTITVEGATFTITKASLPEDPEDPDSPVSSRFKVDGPEDTEYNAGEQKQPLTITDTKTGKKLVEGEDFTLEYPEDCTNVGTKPVKVTGKGNYGGTATVSYKITQAPLTITADSAKKEYDGQPLTDDGWSDTAPAGLKGSDAVDSVKVTGTITDAGKADNVPSAAVVKNGDADVTKNYDITYVKGTLEVTRASLPEDPEDPDSPVSSRFKVDGPEDTVYNGADQKQPVTITDTKTGKKLVEGKDFTLEYPEDVRNVGTKPVKVTGKGNYGGTAKVTYEITKAPVTVKADDKTKAYGEDDPKLTAVVNGLVGDDTIDLIKYVVERAVGEAVGKYAITASGEAVQGNYDVTYEGGEFEITPAEITDTPEDPEDPSSKRFDVSTPDDVKYNGESQKQPVRIHDNKTGKDLVEGEDFTLSYSEDTVNVGQVKVTVKGKGSYTGEVFRTYKITPRHLVVTSATDEKVYDGTALTNHDVTIGGDGLAAKDEGALTFDVTGSQTLVGSSANTFTYEWTDASAEEAQEEVRTGAVDTLKNYFTVYAAESAVANNYVVEKVEGTLTVTDDGADPDKVVSKTHEDKAYKAGDEVTFTVKATNIYDEAKTITLEEKEGVKLAQSVFENVKAGTTVTTTATYTLTDADAEAGTFENIIKAKFSGEDTEFNNNDKVTNIGPADEPEEEPEEEEPEEDVVDDGDDDGEGGNGRPKTGDDGFAADLLALLGAGAALGAIGARRRKREQE